MKTKKKYRYRSRPHTQKITKKLNQKRIKPIAEEKNSEIDPELLAFIIKNRRDLLLDVSSLLGAFLYNIYDDQYLETAFVNNTLVLIAGMYTTSALCFGRYQAIFYSIVGLTLSRQLFGYNKNPLLADKIVSNYITNNLYNHAASWFNNIINQLPDDSNPQEILTNQNSPN